jgi:hypothetical protein
MNRAEWGEKICAVEHLLKLKELDRCSPKEEITDVTFFRISYKLQVLKRMKEWLEMNGDLPKSYKYMLKHPNDAWG